MATREVAVRSGHFYAVRCLQALGIADTNEGVVRASLVHYNTPEEVDRFSDCLKALLS
jgi:selenocysteine lyase/cysteine desulfurase